MEVTGCSRELDMNDEGVNARVGRESSKNCPGLEESIVAEYLSLRRSFFEH